MFNKNLFKEIIKCSLVLIIIYFAGRQLAIGWSKVKLYNWEISISVIACSVVLQILTFVLFSKAWRVLISAFGFNVSLKHGFKIAYIANLGRYIPGKVWTVFGIAYYLRKININLETAIASWGIATILGLPPAFIVGSITVYYYPQMLTGVFASDYTYGTKLLLLATVAFSTVVVFIPRYTILIYNMILRLFKKPPIQFELSRKVALQVYIWYLFGWVLYGIAFYVFTAGIMEIAEVPLFAGIGSFVLAYVIGYLAFFHLGDWVRVRLY
ncbi:MAG: lysylphosphatidylglycerol synthase domain-containing protein [candidate division Zixibacteria bacterium]